MTRVSKALELIVLFGAIYTACGYCEPPKVKSGTYILAADGSAAQECEWLVGSEIMIDRESGAATIRYERDGTTYEVHFTLEE